LGSLEPSIEEVERQLRCRLGGDCRIERHAQCVPRDLDGGSQAGGKDITWPISLLSTANVVPSLACSTTTAIAECPDRSADLTARRKLTPGCTDTVRTFVAPTANASCTEWFLALIAHPLMPNTASALHSVTNTISDANSGRRATRRVASTQATLRG
jgi:hypothetical protein